MREADRNRFDHFTRSGMLRLPGIVPGDFAGELRNLVLHEDAEQLSRGIDGKIYGLFQRAPELIGRLARTPALVSALTLLLGPNVVMTLNRHNQAAVNRRAQTMSLSRMHRDVLQSSRGVLTAVVYLDESTTANGATMIIPGSHRLVTVGAPQPQGGGTWLDEHTEFDGLADQSVVVVANAGDVLLFDGMCFHTVGENSTDSERVSIVLGFRSNDELDPSIHPSELVQVAGTALYRGNDGPAR